MSTDLETQLAALGRHVNETLDHVGVGEILARSNRSTGAQVDLEQADVDAEVEPVDRRPRWPLAVAAALVVVLVGSVAVIRAHDGSVRPADEPTPSTNVPVTTSPPSTTPTAVDPIASVPSFVPTGNMQTDCSGCPAFLLDDGRVLVAGRVDQQGLFVIQTYDPATEAFSITGRLDGYYDEAALLADGQVMLAGMNGELAIFDPGTGSARIIRTENDQQQIPAGHDYTVQIPVALDDGRALVFSQAGVSEVDLATGVLTPIENMTTPLRDTMVAVPLLDGRVLVMGLPLMVDGDALAETFDPNSGEFVPTGTPRSTMDGLDAIRLIDGRVLVVGSRSDAGGPPAAEIYDPVTGTFSGAGPLSDPTATSASPMALLPDGRVLILETTNSSTAVATTDIFDPATGTFTAGPPTRRPRLRATAVTLEDGSVLVLGSYRGNAEGIPGDGPSSAEIFLTNPLQTPQD